MCGRNSLFLSLDELEDRFDAKLATDGGYTQRYNIAPGAGLEVITNDAPDTIDRYHWGLVPPWADDPSEGLINARSETAAEKRAFRDAWETRPCLVLSTGFYEWQVTGGRTKQPYRIYREDTPAFAMAGLWDRWAGPNETLECVTILTTEPNDVVDPIHDRMPVVLPTDAESAWLAADSASRAELCRPYPGSDLRADPISRRVNNPSTDDPSVIEPVDHEQSGLGEFGAD